MANRRLNAEEQVGIRDQHHKVLASLVPAPSLADASLDVIAGTGSDAAAKDAAWQRHGCNASK